MMRRLTTMRAALEDPRFLGGEDMLGADSWKAWRVILIATMGEALTNDERVIFLDLTGRDAEPGEPVQELWGIVGRRGGKSRAIAALGVYLAACVDYRGVLAPGQVGLLPIISSSKEQAAEVFNYAKGIFSEAPGFRGLLATEPTANTLTLTTRVEIQIRSASFRRARGFTAVAVIGDEVAYWRADESANPDREIVRAVRPALGTTGGPLIMISSPYAKRGEMYGAFRKSYGAAGPRLKLVVKAPTKSLNPGFSDAIIASAFEDDPIGAASEYGAEFRSDVDAFMSEEAVSSVVMQGVHEILPQEAFHYVAFVDAASGGGGDAMAMAIAHVDPADGWAVLDLVLEKRPPFDPDVAVQEFAETLQRYGVTTVEGDKWASGFVEAAFRRHGITYEAAAKPKSDLYRELAPLINAGRVRLLDNQRMHVQLLSLERRTARGGRDSIDHPPGGHDDLINAACGALVKIGAKPDPIKVWEALAA